MKKIVLVMMLVSTIGNAQVQEPTEEVPQGSNKELTQDEYNYLTKGLRDQEEKGLDVKTGYYFTKVSNRTFGKYTFTTRTFIKSEGKMLKAFSIKIESKVSGSTYYLALPLYGNRFLQEYADQVVKFDANLQNYYSIYLSFALRDWYIDGNDFKENYYKTLPK